MGEKLVKMLNFWRNNGNWHLRTFHRRNCQWNCDFGKFKSNNFLIINQAQKWKCDLVLWHMWHSSQRRQNWTFKRTFQEEILSYLSSELQVLPYFANSHVGITSNPWVFFSLLSFRMLRLLSTNQNVAGGERESPALLVLSMLRRCFTLLWRCVTVACGTRNRCCKIDDFYFTT